MKRCHYCNVNIGGNHTKCPLCQSKLLGEDEDNIWPEVVPDKSGSIISRIILFAVLCTSFINLAIDYLFIDTKHFHFSIIVTIWALTTGGLFIFGISRHRELPRIVFSSMLLVSIVSLLTELYLHYYEKVPYYAISTGYIIPIFCCMHLLFIIVFSFIDKEFTNRSLLYLFCSMLIGIVPWIAMFFSKGKPSFVWSLCMLINLMGFIGLFIFKGKTMINEAHKKLHV